MTGVDFTQEEITTYQKLISKSKDKKSNDRKWSATFLLKDGTRCKKFVGRNHDVDPQTRRLFEGVCNDDKSVEKGRPRLTLTKESPADRVLAKEYFVKQFRSQPAALTRLLQLNPNSTKGKRKIMSVLTPVLHHRYDVKPSEFMKGWDLGSFCCCLPSLQ